MINQSNLISCELDKNEKIIQTFLDQLSSETTFFPEVAQCLKKSELLIGVRRNDSENLFGIAGFERYYGIPRIFILIKNEYQGKGLADYMLIRLIDKIRNKNESLLIAFIDRNNFKSLTLHLKHGFIMVGVRWRFFILFKPINRSGKIIFAVLKIIFPFMALRDSMIENVFEPRKRAHQIMKEHALKDHQ